MTTRIIRWLMLLTFACGPRIEEDSGGVGDPLDENENDCDGAGCSPSPLCGEDQRNCYGSLGMGECIDGKCSPVPMGCVGELSPENTCADVCAAEGQGVICVENGCEGATAFGFPGPAHLVAPYCGQSNSTVRDAVVPIEMSCDAPLRFTGDGSFEIYQCCCDHPDF
jgi:hypothetical protein